MTSYLEKQTVFNRMAKKFFLLCLLFLSLPSFAEIKITSISRASDYDLSLSTPTIWGALSGPDCPGDVPCDSCALVTPSTDPAQACSLQKVNTSSLLQICFTHGLDANAKYIVTTTESTASMSIDSSSSTSVAAGSKGCVLISWSSLCDELIDGTNTDCSTKVNKSIYIVADKIGSGTTDTRDSSDESKQINIRAQQITGSGVISSAGCAAATSPCFSAYNLLPGDKKAVLDPVSPIVLQKSSFRSTTTNLDVKSVRFFYAENVANPNAVSLYTSDFKDAEINEDGDFPTNWLKGLTNDVTYSFRAGVVDEAGNVFNILSAADSANGGNSVGTIVPAQVFGVLEDTKCFIASAAYGSILDPHLNILRKFRDDILLKSKLGTSFVETYYKYSPRYAVKLTQHPLLRAAVRIALFPTVVLAYIALSQNLHLFLAAVLLALASLSSFIKFRKQRKSL